MWVTQNYREALFHFKPITRSFIQIGTNKIIPCPIVLPCDWFNDKKRDVREVPL